MTLPDMTDEQLVAWDRDVAPFLPCNPHAIFFTENDIEVQYVKNPNMSDFRPSLYGNTGRDYARWFTDRWLVLMTRTGWDWLPGRES